MEVPSLPTAGDDPARARSHQGAEDHHRVGPLLDEGAEAEGGRR